MLRFRVCHKLAFFQNRWLGQEGVQHTLRSPKIKGSASGILFQTLNSAAFSTFFSTIHWLLQVLPTKTNHSKFITPNTQICVQHVGHDAVLHSSSEKCHVTVYKKCYCRTDLRDTGTNFHRDYPATAPGKKLPPCEELDLPYNVKFVSVQKITFVLRKINKYCCHQSCTFWPQYANKSFVSWGFAPHPIGELTAIPQTP